MGKLDGMTAYLAGGIDRSNDDGVLWRREIRQKCEKKQIEINFFDPTDKPKSLGNIIPCEIGEEKRKVKAFKKAGKWKSACKIVKLYRHYDLRMVDISDFIIIYIDVDIHMCGSYNEIFLAETQKKPILGIIKQKKYLIPDWLLGVIEMKELFRNVNECMGYLKKLNEGEIELDERWVKLKNYVEK